MLKEYYRLVKNYLALDVIMGKKTKQETFAGAQYTYTIEVILPNGYCLQVATSHHFEQNFTKLFQVTYQQANNQIGIPFQTS
jgi:prolyl-tRNA synthetase